jgi:hypothetical protein
MTLPIGVGLNAPIQPLTVPKSDASSEVLEAFKQSLSALSKHDRYGYLQKAFVVAALDGDLQTVSQLNPMLDGRDHQVLSEALLAAVAGGHFEIMSMIFKDRAWLWASDKFSVMDCIVENYNRGSWEGLKYRSVLMDMFEMLASEHRIALVAGFDETYAPKLRGILDSIQKKDPELAEWCEAQFVIATKTPDERRNAI